MANNKKDNNNFNFQVMTINVRGMRSYKKRRKVLHWISKHNASRGITFLQETHTTSECEKELEKLFKGKMIMSHGNFNSRGTAILIGDKLEHVIHDSYVDTHGRYVILIASIQGTEFILVNVYQPNDEKGQIETLKEILQKVNSLSPSLDDPIIWGGDFNVIFDTLLDASGGSPSLKTRTLEVLQTIFEEMDLCDIWRIRNPSLKRFTWNGVAQGRKTNRESRLFRRLDYIFTSNSLQPYIESSKIIPAPSTDHSAVVIDLKSFDEGRQSDLHFGK